MRLQWISVLLFSFAAAGQNNPYADSSIFESYVVISPKNAHDYAIQTIQDARAITSGALTPFMFCTDAALHCQSFQIADDGSYVGHNLSEHDALLLLVSQQERTVANARITEKRELKIRSDPPPPTLKSGESLYRVTDRDIWNEYVLGDTNCQAQQIRILNNNNQKRSTVLHEMMHVATNCSNAKGLHRLINQMSPKLLKLMRENPAVVAYLMQKPDYEGK